MVKNSKNIIDSHYDRKFLYEYLNLRNDIKININNEETFKKLNENDSKVYYAQVDFDKYKFTFKYLFEGSFSFKSFSSSKNDSDLLRSNSLMLLEMKKDNILMHEYYYNNDLLNFISVYFLNIINSNYSRYLLKEFIDKEKIKYPEVKTILSQIINNKNINFNIITIRYFIDCLSSQSIKDLYKKRQSNILLKLNNKLLNINFKDRDEKYCVDDEETYLFAYTNPFLINSKGIHSLNFGEASDFIQFATEEYNQQSLII